MLWLYGFVPWDFDADTRSEAETIRSEVTSEEHSLEPLLMWSRAIDPNKPTSSEYAQPVFWKDNILLGVSSQPGIQIMDKSTGVFQDRLSRLCSSTVLTHSS